MFFIKIAFYHDALLSCCIFFWVFFFCTAYFRVVQSQVVFRQQVLFLFVFLHDCFSPGGFLPGRFLSGRFVTEWRYFRWIFSRWLLLGGLNSWHSSTERPNSGVRTDHDIYSLGVCRQDDGSEISSVFLASFILLTKKSPGLYRFFKHWVHCSLLTPNDDLYINCFYLVSPPLWNHLAFQWDTAETY